MEACRKDDETRTDKVVKVRDYNRLILADSLYSLVGSAAVRITNQTFASLLALIRPRTQEPSLLLPVWDRA